MLLRTKQASDETLTTLALLQPRTAAAEVIRQFDEGKSNKHIKPYQTIFHPGEVHSVCHQLILKPYICHDLSAFARS